MQKSYPLVFLLVFAGVVGVALVGAASVSATPFGTYNPSWDGTSDMRSLADQTGAETHIIRDAEYYQTTAPEGTVVVLLSPESAYTTSEVATLRTFVEQGGTVVVAGDFGSTTNRLLRDLGLGSRLHGALLRDEREYAEGPSLPRATNVTRHPYTADVSQLTLNYATALRVTDENVTHLVETSQYSYLDTNRNDELDENETLRRHTVATVERLDRGRVVVVSDPSVFINAMLDHAGNRQFVTNIVETHDRLGIDITHSGGLPPAAWLVVTIRQSPLVQLICGTLLLFLVFNARRIVTGVEEWSEQSGRPMSAQPAVNADELLASLRHNHPDWDEERLERVAQTLIQREENSRTDD